MHILAFKTFTSEKIIKGPNIGKHMCFFLKLAEEAHNLKRDLNCKFLLVDHFTSVITTIKKS